jgi:hypothetical protein
MIELNGDTVVAITIPQARQVNGAYLKYHYYKSVFDTITVKVNLLEQTIREQQLTIETQAQVSNDYESIITNKNEEIGKMDLHLQSCSEELIKLKKRQRLTRSILGGSIAANILLGVILILK